jgi:hypothetical protein
MKGMVPTDEVEEDDADIMTLTRDDLISEVCCQLIDTSKN